MSTTTRRSILALTVTVVAGLGVAACDPYAGDRHDIVGRWQTRDGSTWIQFVSDGSAVTSSGATARWQVGDHHVYSLIGTVMGATQAAIVSLRDGRIELESNGSHYTLLPAAGPLAGIQDPHTILGPGNARDIWSTSVYSYAPQGGGPGGGLDDDRLRVGGFGDEYVSLVRFNLPDLRPHRTVLLDMYAGPADGSPTSMTLQRIAAPWSWRDGDRLWWRDLPTTASVPLPTLPSPARNAWFTVNITDLYNEWAFHPSSNFGLMLRPVQNNNNFNSFFSSNNVDVAHRPRLRFYDH